VEARYEAPVIDNPFVHAWVAPAYAAARPDVHPHFVDAARRLIAAPAVLARGLDLACGTGLSSRALRRLAPRVLGVDPSTPMLRQAAPEAGVALVAARAEALPARDGAFDVASIGCGYHWCERERLLAEVARVLRPGGWFLIYDSELLGWPDGSREPVERLREAYWSELPPCPRNPSFEPGSHLRAPFALHGSASVAERIRLSPSGLAELSLTQATSVAAIASGRRSRRALRERLHACLAPLFADAAARELLFGGPLHVLRRD
jgi:SAM-dependent methyltransferase